MIGSTITTGARAACARMRCSASAAIATCSADEKCPVTTRSTRPKTASASMSAIIRRNTSGAVACPVPPLAGLRPNMTVGASTGSMWCAASTYCCAAPPMRLAATNEERMSASGMRPALQPEAQYR